MGASPCKCDCDVDRPSIGDPIKPPPCPYDEEVEAKMPMMSAQSKAKQEISSRGPQESEQDVQQASGYGERDVEDDADQITQGNTGYEATKPNGPPNLMQEPDLYEVPHHKEAGTEGFSQPFVEDDLPPAAFPSGALPSDKEKTFVKDVEEHEGKRPLMLEQQKEEQPQSTRVAPLSLRGDVENPTLCFDIEPGKPLGFAFGETSVDSPGEALCVVALDRSSIFHGQILPGDSITAIGGEALGHHGLLQKLQEARRDGGKIEITIQRRPAVFDVEVKFKEDEKMGLLVAQHSDQPNKLHVQKVLAEGAVPLWNTLHMFRQVVSGDWIIAVNGREMNARDLTATMQAERQAGRSMTLRVTRGEGEVGQAEERGPRSPNGRSGPQ